MGIIFILGLIFVFSAMWFLFKISEYYDDEAKKDQKEFNDWVDGMVNVAKMKSWRYMKEDLYQNSKICEPKGLSMEAIRQYYWEQGFEMAVDNLTTNNDGVYSTDRCLK